MRKLYQLENPAKPYAGNFYAVYSKKLARSSICQQSNKRILIQSNQKKKTKEKR
ncbi:hypothetical protein DOY81_009433, partial [Sarcophaga bullata]